jgi:predicted histidine transporter YuiF (NhaC family)
MNIISILYGFAVQYQIIELGFGKCFLRLFAKDMLRNKEEKGQREVRKSEELSKTKVVIG